MAEVHRTLVHPENNELFSSQMRIWKAWQKLPGTKIIHESDSLYDVSYLAGITNPNSILIVGGQTADDCIERHLSSVAQFLKETDKRLVVALSRPATWAMDADPRFRQYKYSADAVIERINQQYGVNFYLIDKA